MSTRIALFVFGAALVLWLSGRSAAAPAPADKPGPSDDDIAKAEKIVKDDLARLKGDSAAVQPIKDDAVNRSFPKYVFFGAFFRQFPVARVLPEGLSSANLYAVGPDGKAQLIKDKDGLVSFFQASIGPVKEDDAAKDAARAYVRLTEELHQDGFFKFKLEDDSTKVGQSDAGKTATARAVVMSGGNGEIAATLTFDSDGKLKTVEEKVNLKPGPRPICQATKLLDADPIVRRIAERDLLIMGRAAKPYLDEQRAKASPELRGAIDAVWRQIVEEDR
jgi:hypothetical protein